MQAREYLRQLKTLDNIINAKLLEKERIRALGEKITPSLTERVQGGDIGDKVANTAIKLVELDEQIQEDIDRMVDLKKEANRFIEYMNNSNHKAILSMYYLSNISFKEIADKLAYSFKWVSKEHTKALKEFDKIINTKLLENREYEL